MTDGAVPEGNLTLSGSTLYGMTSAGGPYQLGTIFSLPISGGSSATVLGVFNGGDGGKPQGSLVISGSTLYGMTEYGGADNVGTIFSLPITGGTPQTMLSLTYPTGCLPYGSLTLIGSTLYGTTSNGYYPSDGNIFGINTDGSGFTILHSFTGTEAA